MSIRELELIVSKIQWQIESRQKEVDWMETKISKLSDDIRNAQLEIATLKISDWEQEKKLINIVDDKRRLLRIVVGAIILALLSLVLITSK